VDVPTSTKVYYPCDRGTGELAKIYKGVSGGLTSWQNAAQKVSKGTLYDKEWKLPLDWGGGMHRIQNSQRHISEGHDKPKNREL